MDTLLQDLRYALRTLRKTASITLLAVLSIGLAIGANATIFTWLDGLVLHPLPAVPALDRIVQLHTLGPQGALWSVSYPDLQDWRAQARGFTGIAGYDIIQASVRTTGQAERAFGMMVTANYFDVLGVRPFLGRGFVRRAAAAASTARGAAERSGDAHVDLRAAGGCRPARLLSPRAPSGARGSVGRPQVRIGGSP